MNSSLFAALNFSYQQLLQFWTKYDAWCRVTLCFFLLMTSLRTAATGFVKVKYYFLGELVVPTPARYVYRGRIYLFGGFRCWSSQMMIQNDTNWQSVVALKPPSEKKATCRKTSISSSEVLEVCITVSPWENPWWIRTPSCPSVLMLGSLWGLAKSIGCRKFGDKLKSDYHHIWGNHNPFTSYFRLPSGYQGFDP